MPARDPSEPISNCPNDASRRYWGFSYPANGWANRPAEERATHVIDRANERGGLVLDMETLASIEAEIRHVRKLAQDSRPRPTYLAKRVFACQAKFRQDYYEVRVGADPHIFVWSRRCDGLVSYAYKGQWKGVPYRPKSHQLATPEL